MHRKSRIGIANPALLAWVSVGAAPHAQKPGCRIENANTNIHGTNSPDKAKRPLELKYSMSEWVGGHYVLSASCVPCSPSLCPLSSLKGLLEGFPALASTQHNSGLSHRKRELVTATGYQHLCEGHTRPDSVTKQLEAVISLPITKGTDHMRVRSKIKHPLCHGP